MNAYLFPGQGSQFPGMAKELYEFSDSVKNLFSIAKEILGFDIADIMFNGTEEDLKQTNVTQPAIFLHSVALATYMGKTFRPDAVAGHSLGEFSALVAAKGLSFEDGLMLVSNRASAMQLACEENPSTMAAILGLDDEDVEDICKDIDGIVVPANYNCPGQLVISGTNKAVAAACVALKEAGAKRTLLLPVGGAFHSPLMESAREALSEAIEEVEIMTPICPIYQNVDALPHTDTDEIKINLIKQLTSPVLWTQIVQSFLDDGFDSFIEVGPGNVLQGLVKKVDRDVRTASARL